MRSIARVVVIGANCAVAVASSALFAAAGLATLLLGKTLDQAEAARARAELLGQGAIAPGLLTAGSYEADLAGALATADLVFESAGADTASKRAVLAAVDRLRQPATIVASMSSATLISELCAGRSLGFQRNFLGLHLFHPATALTGCELIPHARTDPGALAAVRDALSSRLGREVIETADAPGFAGNRLGFRLLNEVAQLAEEHGVAFMDQLVGPHTGRAMPPLATIDLIGWDAHQTIVDQLYAATYDLAHDLFRLPRSMQRWLDLGHLGRKTPDKGGFYRRDGSGPGARLLVIDLATGTYRPLAELKLQMPAFVHDMKAALRGASPVPGYRRAMEILCTASGREAELLRRILLGYLSYGLGLVGDVVARPRDIDRIMAFGFHWAPPSMLVDAIGPGRTIAMLERAKLPVPRAVLDAAVHQRALFDEPRVDRARFFATA